MLPIYHVELLPTDFALRLRPGFIASLLVLALLVLGKFMIRDWWGAVSLVFVILMGLFVISGQYRVNASSALFYCVMAVISGVFDVISCVLYFQHSKYKMFDHRASNLALLAQGVFLLSPAALFSSAMVSYAIFSDCRDHAQDLMPLRGAAAGVDYAAALGWEATAAPGNQAAPVQHQPMAPVPFSGHGQRLDGT
eukprot:CAMPEP_0115656000 /NCGR_PEP_ID=MMETSP0272-20121206/43932_1 /TAXON_ID=71861 /ORGANISM="Scrippsiella trochoidea, Strain CCMP3099" /LENGTH=194 /DNA_ID=CAMNT_0003093969 /DNA_START=140 /DNA_END=720 /DNA_ORIENTATION=+